MTYTFDSGTELAASTVSPGLAYVAFYSDVTHAVEPVQTGHRVTLTYNLFLVDRTLPAAGTRMVPASELALGDSLRTLLVDPSFLPHGGFLAFGLAYQYPMPPAPDATLVNGEWAVPPSRLGPVLQMLKGSDARIRTVSEQAGLVTRVKVLYDSGSTSDEAGNDVLVDDVLNMEHFYESYEEGTKARKEIDSKGVVLAQGEEQDDEDMEKEPVNSMAVHWVTKITETNRVTSRYIAYGNYPSIQHVYGNAALHLNSAISAPRPHDTALALILTDVSHRIETKAAVANMFLWCKQSQM
ncbi:hypothetical protein B0H19DRAFT_1237211 [Mycena capillaripes]|nr:hypothetical protein B0H19DRAFT_1237211 [Mycena capillaripes]